MMPKFIVTVAVEDSDQFEVEAEDEEAAWDIAEAYRANNYSFEWDVIDVEEFEDDMVDEEED